MDPTTSEIALVDRASARNVEDREGGSVTLQPPSSRSGRLPLVPGVTVGSKVRKSTVFLSNLKKAQILIRSSPRGDLRSSRNLSGLIALTVSELLAFKKSRKAVKKFVKNRTLKLSTKKSAGR
jgi:hypothetical protein